ncbi:saccharopine dehydrogenase NADP-binding domain-containing protein, partial [Halobacillus sp. BBL2006]|uniref:saccharopine dehydrogenase NADP-binding domain-containing protein n=1 Tax=Halobacillus sp. BBL2006 TaxID=1543706 RepID=UPI000543DB47
MKVAVLGSGLMGKEAARDLVHSAGVEKVGLADIDVKRAEAVCSAIGSPKIQAYQVDAGNTKELAAFLQNFDVVINALFYSFNEIVAKTAIEVGVHSVDLGGHIGHITDKVLNHNEEA